MGFSIAPLDASHAIATFDCGQPALNAFLAKHALQNQSTGGARTYVLVKQNGVVCGYFSLAAGHVAHADAPERLAKGLARHPVPVMVLARLAVSLDRRGEGLGAALLKDAILRTLAAADIAGIRAIIVQAKDGAAHAFYTHFGFAAFEDDPLRLYLLVKDARAMTRA
jgi:GNAT superfamily N-acetyltransferase